MFFRLIILLLSFNLASQEYEITSENIEIDTELNTINYEFNVTFKSDEIFFTADKLKLNQNNESFIAYGSPVKIKFFDVCFYRFDKIKVFKIFFPSFEIIITKTS